MAPWRAPAGYDWPLNVSECEGVRAPSGHASESLAGVPFGRLAEQLKLGFSDQPVEGTRRARGPQCFALLSKILSRLSELFHSRLVTLGGRPGDRTNCEHGEQDSQSPEGTCCHGLEVLRHIERICQHQKLAGGGCYRQARGELEKGIADLQVLLLFLVAMQVVGDLPAFRVGIGKPCLHVEIALLLPGFVTICVGRVQVQDVERTENERGRSSDGSLNRKR